MHKESWTIVTRNLLQLLKPGDALQWIEGDFFQSAVPLGNAVHSTTSALEELAAAAFRDGLDLRYGVFALPGIWKELGMRDIRSQVVSTDRMPETREEATYIGLGAFISIMKAMGLATEEELQNLRARVEGDICSDGYYRWDLRTVFTFKA